MPTQTGIFDIASLRAATNTTAVTVGEDTIAAIIAADNAAYDAAMTLMLSDLTETSADRQRVVGSSLGGSMVEVDEYGQSPTQQSVPGYFVGFPLMRTQYSVGWTTQFMKNAMAADFAVRNGAAQGAYQRRVRYELQKAIYMPTNRTYIDHLVDKASLPVKAMINADSTAMANGPNGETFDGASHTHYDASATLTAAAFQALIDDVTEHRNGARVRVAANVADAAVVSALTGFVALQVPYVTLGTASNQPTARLDIMKADNRQIGWFGGAEVWTKPWAVANYAVAFDVDAPAKPLVRRVETNDRGLHIAGESDSHPLRAEFFEAFYGFGAWNRTALAVLRFNNVTYAAPSLSY